MSEVNSPSGSSRKRKQDHLNDNDNNSDRPAKKGRPRRSCVPCNKSKVKCEGSERPCPRCIKRGKAKECFDLDGGEATGSRPSSDSESSPIRTELKVSEDEDTTDLTDLIEMSIQVYHSSAEKWKNLIVENPSKW
jgi:hypothetical protein